jgi:hypothetical protein
MILMNIATNKFNAGLKQMYSSMQYSMFIGVAVQISDD